MNHFTEALVGRVEKPVFGVGQTPYMAPLHRWRGSPRPIPRPIGVPKGIVESCQAVLQKPGVLLIKGKSRSGKTALVGELCRFATNPMFYYSFAFGRNNPEDIAFYAELQHFLRSRGLLSLENFREFWVQLLLRNGGTIVLDDPPFTLALDRRNAAIDTLRLSFINVVFPIAAIISQEKTGNLVLIWPTEVPSSLESYFLSVLHSIQDLSITVVEMPEAESFDERAAVKKLSQSCRVLLTRMLWLRYAEPAEVIARLLTTSEPITALLGQLEEVGFISQYSGRYLVRLATRSRLLTKALNSWKTEKLVRFLQDTAQVFEDVAEQPDSGNSLHYLLEAESAWFSSSASFETDDWKKGVRTLLSVTRSFTANQLSREFFLRTLEGYRRLGGKIFGHCDLVDLNTLNELFGRSTSHERDQYAALILEFWSEVERRGEIVDVWIKSFRELQQTAYLDRQSVCSLMVGIRKMRKTSRQFALSPSDWQLLGRMNYAIAKASVAEASVKVTRSWMYRSLRHALRANACFHRAQDQNGGADAARLLGNIFMTTGQVVAARNAFLSSFRHERNLPGFDALKAAGLHNLFWTYLASGSLRKAEGLFWEANYQYFASNRTMSFVALSALATTGIMSPPGAPISKMPDKMSQLPHPADLADKAVSLIPLMTGSDAGENSQRAIHNFCKGASIIASKGDCGTAGRIYAAMIKLLDGLMVTAPFEPAVKQHIVKLLSDFVRDHHNNYGSDVGIRTAATGVTDSTLRELLAPVLS